MAMPFRPATMAPRRATVVLRILLLALVLLAGSIVVGRDQLVAAFPWLGAGFERLGMAVPPAGDGEDSPELDQPEDP